MWCTSEQSIPDSLLATTIFIWTSNHSVEHILIGAWIIKPKYLFNIQLHGIVCGTGKRLDKHSKVHSNKLNYIFDNAYEKSFKNLVR